MSRFTKILLALTIINLAAAALFLSDIVDVSSFPSLYVTFPVGVVLCGMFLISLMLEKEIAAFDEEQIKKAKTNKEVPVSPSAPREAPSRDQAPLDRVA